ncbi:MAG: hypothetical protein LUO89_03400 [Methanothrix sp.]|nr:hypothetical protein [Methanothrix sp.]
MFNRQRWLQDSTFSSPEVSAFLLIARRCRRRITSCIAWRDCSTRTNVCQELAFEEAAVLVTPTRIREFAEFHFAAEVSDVLIAVFIACVLKGPHAFLIASFLFRVRRQLLGLDIESPQLL